MPQALTYPGVYIEEVASGVRTITGVATSITAFVGRARRGPVDNDPLRLSPVRVHSFAEYQRVFGGVWNQSPMSFAVSQFFQNGGSDALIVRVVGTNAATATLTNNGLTLSATSPGTWGRLIEATITDDDGAGGTLPAPLFNLIVRDTDPANDVREVYFGLSTDATHARHVQRVLLGSSLVRATAVPAAPNRPNPAAATLLAVADTADGDPVGPTRITDVALEATQQGIYALERADLFNILVIPPYAPDKDVAAADLGPALAYCRRRRAILLVDPPAEVDTIAEAIQHANDVGRDSNAAFFFPRVRAPNPLRENRLDTFAPSGAVAGVMARTDATRGVWKSAAGTEATLTGVSALALKLTDPQNGELNPLGVNCLRDFPVYGRVVWGSRTLAGADALTSEWKYLAVRRMALFLEESLYRGTQWVVFEPNDEPLWAQIRLNIGAFLQGLFRQGAFQGSTPKEAYFVKCDRETTTQADINLGIVNIIVGFAPLKPAEFVVIKLQQIAGDIPT
ncbi:phage tail sheath family protein [Variovorax sp. JS1663]|uniref:phage tail sheath family protein n=1 Tax=Variovorax sp. JS1663 TaxID=1851577 RepID=UPI000B348550|nr:phage tail sheath C-terminal domain-containing protein [Variovorax sp. JS1663]OUL98525.1 phage tail protein [Variovorax sp. JS1663]